MKVLRRIALTTAGAAAVVIALFAIGDRLRDSVRERHSLAVSEIDCDPPPNASREQFLGEVHYYGQLTERLNVLDADLPERLKTAFAKHPRVQRVEQVTISAPNHVRVELTYLSGNH